MNIKSTLVSTNTQQSQLANLSAVGIYNLRVTEFISNNPLSYLQEVARKQFRERLNRENLTSEKYNNEVEAFNGQGFIVYKVETEKIAYSNQTKEYGYINYAIFDRDCITASLKNFEQQRIEKNKYAKEKNLDIAIYNAEMVKNVEDLTDLEKKAKKAFKAANTKLIPEQYNAVVEASNENNPIYCKKKIPTIKVGFSKQVFLVCLYFYGAQLRVHNADMMNQKKSTGFNKNEVPMLHISPNDIMRYRQDGVRQFENNQDKTIRRHIRRFLEVGIIKDYKTTNSIQRARWRFNEKIIVIKEGNLPKSQSPKNQDANIIKRTNCYDSNKTTSTIIKEKEKKDDLKEISFSNTGSMLQSMQTKFAALAYKNKPDDNNKKKQEGCAKNFSYDPQLSKNIREIILDDVPLADFMTKKILNDQNKYKVFNYKHISELVNKTDLEGSEISAFLAQDFVKSNWKMYKNHNVVFGEWKRAIRRIRKDWFDGPIENIYKKHSQKENRLSAIIELVKEYREKLEIARKRWLKYSFNCSFPYQYYDIKRTETRHLAFFGVHKIYVQKKNNEKIDAMKDKAEQRIILRNNKAKSEIANYERALTKYYTGKYTREQLFTYVQNNLNSKYLKELAQNINSNNVFTA